MKLVRRDGNNNLPAPSTPLARLNPTLDRRNFLRAAGLGGLGAGLFAFSGPSFIREVEAQGKAQPRPSKLDQFKTICTKCAVGCGLIGEVQNNVWVSQEPWYENPINQGSLCSKGAAARSSVISEKRLRYPLKLEGGRWKRLNWEQAMTEVADKLKSLRDKFGPDILHICFSAHYSNENGYAIRKWAALWGTNNADFQARI